MNTGIWQQLQTHRQLTELVVPKNLKRIFQHGCNLLPEDGETGRGIEHNCEIWELNQYRILKKEVLLSD